MKTNQKAVKYVQSKNIIPGRGSCDTFRPTKGGTRNISQSKRRKLRRWILIRSSKHTFYTFIVFLFFMMSKGYLQRQETTRMHSSRMRTARFNGHLYRWGGGCLPSWGVSRGVVFACVVSARGVCVYQHAMGSGCLPLPHCMLGYTHPLPLHVGIHPPLNRMTDRCKNITLPQTSFAGGNYTRKMCVYTCFREVLAVKTF